MSHPEWCPLCMSDMEERPLFTSVYYVCVNCDKEVTKDNQNTPSELDEALASLCFWGPM